MSTTPEAVVLWDPALCPAAIPAVALRTPPSAGAAPFQPRCPIRTDIFREGSGREHVRLSQGREKVQLALSGASLLAAPYLLTELAIPDAIARPRLSYPVLPDKNLIVIPRDDDLMFGLLHSRFHEAWALRKGSDLQDRPRYTHTTTFATFPFPEGMTPADDLTKARSLPAAGTIEAAAQRLDELRNAWLYPVDMVRRVPESVSGFPDRIVPKDEKAAEALSQRTLTALYNDRPGWLVEAHRSLDEAVAAAYGWSADIETDDALHRLLDLNLARSAKH